MPPLGSEVVVNKGLTGSPPGEVDTPTDTLPEKPFTLTKVTFAVLVRPWETMVDTGFAETTKSSRSIAAVNASWSTQPNRGSLVSQAFRLSDQMTCAVLELAAIPM